MSGENAPGCCIRYSQGSLPDSWLPVLRVGASISSSLGTFAETVYYEHLHTAGPAYVRAIITPVSQYHRLGALVESVDEQDEMMSTFRIQICEVHASRSSETNSSEL